MEIQIEFITAEVLAGLSVQEKMSYVLEHVKEDKILVIEEGMSPLEETALIKATMEEVSQKFPGIEVSTLREKTEEGIKEKLIRLLGGRIGGLTVIGPSRIIREIKKDPRRITMLAGDEDKSKKPKK